MPGIATQLGSCLRGTPQGNALGPLLFWYNNNYYVNNMPLQIPIALCWWYLFHLLWKHSICYITTCGYSVECVDIARSIWTCIQITLYKLSWRSHVASMCKKMAYYRLPSYIWMDITKILYKSSIKMLVASLVMSHLNIHFL